MNPANLDMSAFAALLDDFNISPEGRAFLRDLDADPQGRFATRGLWLDQIRNAARVFDPDLHLEVAQIAYQLPIDRYAWIPIHYACLIMGHLGAFQHPSLGFVDGANQVMRDLTPHLLKKGLMATMLAGCEGQLTPFIRVIANSTRLLVNRGTVRFHEAPDARGGTLTYRDHCSAWIEIAIGGFWLGTGDALGLDVSTRFVRRDRYNCDLLLRW